MKYYSSCVRLAVLVVVLLLPTLSMSQAQPINIALGANPTESDPGWGGGVYPWDMVDGLTLYPNWPHGLAFTGGIPEWMGVPCGWRQATLNFGAMKTFSRVMIWHHGPQHIPNTFQLKYWNGYIWQDVGGFSRVRWDLTTPAPGEAGAGSTPTEHIFPAVTGSKVRFELNNCDIEHGWIYEFEVFNNLPPVCDLAAPSIATLWPPEHQMVTVNIMGITDPDGDPITIAVNSIFQDERINGLGDGDTAPDGWGIDTTTAVVRAERAGTGNGRVYVIGYTASDGLYGSCTGTVTVKVNHNQGKKGAAINDGAIYNSTGS